MKLGQAIFFLCRESDRAFLELLTPKIIWTETKIMLTNKSKSIAP